MGNPKSKDDLWEQFLQEDNSDHKPAKVPSDGSEWTGEFDRRKKPRDENLTEEEVNDLRSNDAGRGAANDSYIDGESTSDSDK